MTEKGLIEHDCMDGKLGIEIDILQGLVLGPFDNIMPGALFCPFKNTQLIVYFKGVEQTQFWCLTMHCIGVSSSLEL